MSPNITFFVGILVQVSLAVLQVTVLVIFVYRWQRDSWRYGNIMKIREPLARAYCSLTAVARARTRLEQDAGDERLARHDRIRLDRYLSTTGDEIVNFSVEHFKAKFWMEEAENRQLDLLFDKLRDVWSVLRNPVTDSESLLNGLRAEILRFDDICGLRNYNQGKWSHVALEA